MPKMTDAERVALAQKLDVDLEEFIREAEAKSVPRPKPDIDAILSEMDTHPAFAKEIDLSKPLHPLTEALQAIKYDSESPDENAESYKDEGNEHFKRKSYRYAVDNYSQGIKLQPVDKLLNAQLYTNRAAAQSHLGNCRSAFTDCVIARKFVPDHMKAIIRGAQCCIELNKAELAISWCDEGLHFTPTDKKLIEMRSKAEKIKRQQERDKRKELAKERKQECEEKAMIAAIKERGVRLAEVASDKAADQLLLSSLETHHPGGAKVHFGEDGALAWPVLFMYPEYAQTDSILAFSENSSFQEHIQMMLGEEPPAWEESGAYKPQYISIFVENKEQQTLHKIDPASTLGAALRHKKLVVTAGTPTFFLLSTKSKFTESFLASYKYNTSS